MPSYEENVVENHEELIFRLNKYSEEVTLFDSEYSADLRKTAEALEKNSTEGLTHEECSTLIVKLKAHGEEEFDQHNNYIAEDLKEAAAVLEGYLEKEISFEEKSKKPIDVQIKEAEEIRDMQISEKDQKVLDKEQEK